MCTVCMQYLGRSEEAVGCRGTGVTDTDTCELPFVFWELNQGPLQEKLVLLTAVPPMIYIFLIVHKNKKEP